MSDDVIGVTDIDEVFLTFGPHRIRGFPASGTFFVPTKLNPDEVAAEEGLDGNLAIIKRKGNATVIDLTLTRESASNTVLWGLLQTQRNVPGIPFLPFMCKHQGTKLSSGSACFMTGPAGPPIGDGPQQLAWRFLCAKFEGVLTGLALIQP